MSYTTITKKVVRTVLEKDGTRTETITETTTTGGEPLAPEHEAVVRESEALLEKAWKDFDAVLAKFQRMFK